jgi:hypothetical protein
MFSIANSVKPHLNSISAILRTLARDAQRKRDLYGKTLGAGAEQSDLKLIILDCAHRLFRAVCCPAETFRICLPQRPDSLKPLMISKEV